jgi:hypothetical protein
VLVRRDAVLRTDQLSVPVRWLVTVSVRLPEVSDEELEPAFGPGRSRKLKSWGHDEGGVHWLVTRGGTDLHTDPTYLRYTHHLVVRNDGFRIRGFSDEAHPPMVPGTMYCLDTHSPHEVVVDARLGEPAPCYKVQLAVDREEPMSPADVWGTFRPWVLADRRPGETAASATLIAPRPKKPL